MPLRTRQKVSQGVLGIEQPQLANSKREMPRHGDQQYLQQRRQIQGAQQHEFYFLGLLVKITVNSEGFHPPAVPQLCKRCQRGSAVYDLYVSLFQIVIICHALCPFFRHDTAQSKYFHIG